MKPPRLPWPLFVVSAILLLGTMPRFWALDLVDFSGDEATQLFLARALVARGEVPLVGLASSLAIPTPPLEVFLLAVPTLLSTEVWGAHFFVAWLGVLALPLLHRFTASFFSPTAALWASLFFAVSFWPVILTRKIWDVGLMPLFVLLLFFSLYRLLYQGRSWQIGAVLLWLVVLVQIHPSALVLWLWVGVALLLVRPRISLRGLLVGGLLALGTLAPFLTHLWRGGWRDALALGEKATAPAPYDLQGLIFLRELVFPSLDAPIFMTSQGTVVPQATLLEGLRLAALLFFTLGLGVLIASGLFSWVRQNKKKAPQGMVLALLPVIAVFSYWRHPYELFQHYLFVLVPAIAVLWALLLTGAGHAATKLVARGSAPWCWASYLVRTLLPAFAAALLIAQGSLFLALMGWVAQGRTTFWYGVPLRTSLGVLAELSQLQQGDSGNPVVLVGHGDYPVVFSYLSQGHLPLRQIQAEQGLLIPGPRQGYQLFLTTYDPLPASQLLAQHFRAYQVRALPYGQEGDVFRLYRVPASSLETFQAPYSLEVTLANGLRLWGSALDAAATPGAELTIALFWEMLRKPPEGWQRDYRIFTHLVDDQGRRWAGADGMPYPPQQWQERDTLVSWFHIPVPEEAPPGPYWVQVGMYDAHSMQRVLTTGGADATKLGPVEVRG